MNEMCLGIKLLHREFSRHLSGGAKPRRARVKKKKQFKKQKCVDASVGFVRETDR